LLPLLAPWLTQAIGIGDHPSHADTHKGPTLLATFTLHGCPNEQSTMPLDRTPAQQSDLGALLVPPSVSQSDLGALLVPRHRRGGGATGRVRAATEGVRHFCTCIGPRQRYAARMLATQLSTWSLVGFRAAKFSRSMKFDSPCVPLLWMKTHLPIKKKPDDIEMDVEWHRHGVRRALHTAWSAKPLSTGE